MRHALASATSEKLTTGALALLGPIPDQLHPATATIGRLDGRREFAIGHLDRKASEVSAGSSDDVAGAPQFGPRDGRGLGQSQDDVVAPAFVDDQENAILQLGEHPSFDAFDLPGPQGVLQRIGRQVCVAIGQTRQCPVPPQIDFGLRARLGPAPAVDRELL